VFDQVIKSESGSVQKTFPSHSKAVMSLVSGVRYTVTTGEDFEVHVYQTSALMKSCEGFVDNVTLLGLGQNDLTVFPSMSR